MTVLTFHEDLLSPRLAAHRHDGHGPRMTGVLTHHRVLPLHDDDMIFDHVDDTAAPHDIARSDFVRARLIRDRPDLVARQKMHVVSHSFSSKREE